MDFSLLENKHMHWRNSKIKSQPGTSRKYTTYTTKVNKNSKTETHKHKLNKPI